MYTKTNTKNGQPSTTCTENKKITILTFFVEQQKGQTFPVVYVTFFVEQQKGQTLPVLYVSKLLATKGK
jgi:hypothetical protein